MDKYLLWCLTASLLILCFVACNDDNDDHTITPSEILTHALYQKFPEATSVEWRTSDEYYVAGFYWRGEEYKAWFDQNGLWFRTSHAVTYSEVPEIVKNALSNSAYSSWVVKGIEKIEELDILYYHFMMNDSSQTIYINISGDGFILGF